MVLKNDIVKGEAMNIRYNHFQKKTILMLTIELNTFLNLSKLNLNKSLLQKSRSKSLQMFFLLT